MFDETQNPAAPAELNIGESASEANLVSERPEPLDELKALIQEVLNKHEFTSSPPPPPVEEEEKPEEKVEVKAQEAPASAAHPAEEPKVEEKVEVTEVAAAGGETSSTLLEGIKEEEKVDVKEGEVPPPPAETVVLAAEVMVVEKVTAVDEDGAKTVEAIEETIGAVSSSVPPEAAEKPKEEGEAAESPTAPIAPEEVFICGIPLLGDEKSDVILLKFLRARDFKVKDAFMMIKNTVKWRKEFGIEALLEEDLGNDLEKTVFMHGFDREGHPVLYIVYGAFEDKKLYQNCFADEEKRVKSLRWMIQLLEKSIRKLDFSPTGVCTIVQVNDFNNSSEPFKRELRQVTKQALDILQNNYPEFVAKQIFIDVPKSHHAFYSIRISPLLTQRTKSKFELAGKSESAETLFKYICPGQVPVQYGGLSREGEREFTVSNPVTEDIIKPGSGHVVNIPISEKCTLLWELRVLGWDVSYDAKFVPSQEGSYTMIVSKTRKVNPTDETIIIDSYIIEEAGKIVLTIANQTSKNKKLFYRIYK